MVMGVMGMMGMMSCGQMIHNSGAQTIYKFWLCLLCLLQRGPKISRLMGGIGE